MRSWLFGLWSRVSEQFGFEMVEGPVLESEELFTRKAGEEIVDQLYNFEVSLNHSQTHMVSLSMKIISANWKLRPSTAWLVL